MYLFLSNKEMLFYVYVRKLLVLELIQTSVFQVPCNMIHIVKIWNFILWLSMEKKDLN